MIYLVFEPCILQGKILPFEQKNNISCCKQRYSIEMFFIFSDFDYDTIGELVPRVCHHLFQLKIVILWVTLFCERARDEKLSINILSMFVRIPKT